MATAVGVAIGIWVICAVIVASDARNLGVKAFTLQQHYGRKFKLDASANGWFVFTLLFGVIGLICYLAVRPRYVEIKEGRVAQRFQASQLSLSDSAIPPVPAATIPRPPVPSPSTRAATPTPPPPGTPAGWFSDPVGQYEHRYWDGSRWTEHVVSASGEQTTHFL